MRVHLPQVLLIDLADPCSEEWQVSTVIDDSHMRTFQTLLHRLIVGVSPGFVCTCWLDQ